MFSVEGIEVLGTPLVTDIYIKACVCELSQDNNGCCKETWSSHWLFCPHSTDKFCMNTRTRFMSVNIMLPPQEYFLSAEHRHVDTDIANVILQKDTRGCFRQWDKNFLGWVGSLSPDEQNGRIPNQVVHDPDTWTAPQLLQLKREYEILVDAPCIRQEMFTVQEPPDPPSEVLLLPPLKCLHKANVRIQEQPQPGEQLVSHIQQTIQIPGFKTSTPGLALTMLTRP